MATAVAVDVEDTAKVAFALLTEGGHHGRGFEITGRSVEYGRDRCCDWCSTERRGEQVIID